MPQLGFPQGIDAAAQTTISILHSPQSHNLPPAQHNRLHQSSPDAPLRHSRSNCDVSLDANKSGQSQSKKWPCIYIHWQRTSLNISASWPQRGRISRCGGRNILRRGQTAPRVGSVLLLLLLLLMRRFVHTPSEGRLGCGSPACGEASEGGG